MSELDIDNKNPHRARRKLKGHGHPSMPDMTYQGCEQAWDLAHREGEEMRLQRDLLLDLIVRIYKESKP